MIGNMACVAERASVAPGFKHRPREKPVIYNTIDGQVIVEDEFLNFLAVKIKTMTQDELVLVASNTFNSEWIESSKKVLFELCPDTKQRCVGFKGNQKDANNIKSCLKVLNECGDKIPRFVSHYLDELPPVTFNNLDVSSLLSKMERIYSEISTLRHAVKLQADVSETLHSVTATLGCRVDAAERRLESSTGGRLIIPAGENKEELAKGSAPGFHAGPTGVKVPTSPRTKLSFGDGGACVEAGIGSGTMTRCPTPGGTMDNSPKWSRVVKKARRKTEAEGQIASRAGKPERRVTKPIVGTGAQGTIRVIRTKLVSVFATKFSPDLDAETLSEYLSGQIGRSVNCQRIVTAGNRYSSFKVSAECNEVNEMYKPELWPEGSIVRRYYEPRKVEGPGASKLGLSDSLSVRVGLPIGAVATRSS